MPFEVLGFSHCFILRRTFPLIVVAVGWIEGMCDENWSIFAAFGKTICFRCFRRRCCCCPQFAKNSPTKKNEFANVGIWVRDSTRRYFEAQPKHLIWNNWLLSITLIWQAFTKAVLHLNFKHLQFHSPHWLNAGEIICKIVCETFIQRPFFESNQKVFFFFQIFDVFLFQVRNFAPVAKSVNVKAGVM